MLRRTATTRRPDNSFGSHSTGCTTLLRIGVWRDDTDNLVQETYLWVFRSLRNYRGDGAGFVPWLLAIARNVCATEVRRRVRRAVFNRLMTFRHDSVVSSPAALLELDELVRGLAVEQREAFVLTQMIGLSYEEAARTCDCPVGTIRSRVARARSALFARLERAQAEA
jgi:RNA polymerase sigma-70 factor (ECF subfamily)